MATVRNLQRAHAVGQIDTLDITGAGASNDTVTLKINEKELVVTVGTGTTRAQIAATIRDAWNSLDRLDGTATGNTNTTNVGAQRYGEFAEIRAEIYSTSDTIVRFFAKTLGVPFTLAVSKTGTVTISHTASSQTATGPEWWNNIDNWAGGAVPADGDSILLANSEIGFKYGLPTTLELRTGNLQIDQSFTGWLGLPQINRSNPSLPYPEYRTRYAKFESDDGITPGTPDIIVGLGSGFGSPLLNIEYDAMHANAVSTWRIYKTGTAQPTISQYAVNIATDATSSKNDLLVYSGSVCCGVRADGKTCNLRDIWLIQQGAQAKLLLDDVTSAEATMDIVQDGGELVIEIINPPTDVTHVLRGGQATWNAAGTPASVITVDEGTVKLLAAATLTTVTIGRRGIVDCNEATQALTATNVDMYAESSLIDENGWLSVTNGPDLIRCGMEDVTLRRGKHIRVTKGSVS